MSKSEIEKIKAELLRLNNVARGFLKTDTRNDTVINLTNALEIAVDYIHDNFNDPAAQKSLKQISEILVGK